jgi:alkylglycerol monooxygenase
MVDYIVLAIPVFILLIGVELAYSRWRGLALCRLSDSLASIGTGIVDQLGRVMLNAVFAFTAYSFIYERWAFVRLESWPAVHWIVGFVGADLCYYWWHRKAHEVNFIWAGHVVHHQSEEYNLSTALRQSPFTALTSWAFYLPLALLGVSPIVFAASKSFMVLYQFWLHTRAVSKLARPFEAVFNSPSHHRVHHGINPRYIDRNYAGTFIFWDRLFGTFEPESEPVSFGVLKPLKSWNPVWAQLHYWSVLWKSAASFPRWRDRALIWLKPPGWEPGPGASSDINSAYEQVIADKYDVPVSSRRAWYLVAQFALVLGGTTLVLFQQRELERWQLFGAAALVFLSLVSLSALAEKKSFARTLEGARLFAVISFLAVVIWQEW